jgi:2-polyprenyl-6-methoxyphenol hydroxylase-like FAD-dependent oxidoreductase
MFLFVFRSREDEAIADDPEARKAVLRREFADAGWECARILDAVDASDDLYFDVVSQVRIPAWSQGRVALVGDAAAWACVPQSRRAQLPRRLRPAGLRTKGTEVVEARRGM